MSFRLKERRKKIQRDFHELAKADSSDMRPIKMIRNWLDRNSRESVFFNVSIQIIISIQIIRIHIQSTLYSPLIKDF